MFIIPLTFELMGRPHGLLPVCAPAHQEGYMKEIIQYGVWAFDPEEMTLTISRERGNDCYEYDIDLDSITDSATMLDWIMQINTKYWGRGHVTADLIDALRDIFDPQRTMCSFGKNRTINARQAWGRSRGLKELREASPITYVV